MGQVLKQRSGIFLAFCITTSACGDTPDILTNAAQDPPPISQGTAIPDPLTVDVIDRKPRKILSPDERRRADALLRVYRETNAGDDPTDRELAIRALDEIDPRILQDERRREAARQAGEVNRSVDEMIAEREARRARDR